MKLFTSTARFSLGLAAPHVFLERFSAARSMVQGHMEHQALRFDFCSGINKSKMLFRDSVKKPSGDEAFTPVKMFNPSKPLHCSFCNKTQEQVEKLISSPSDHKQAYICDECIRVCQTILDNEKSRKANVPMVSGGNRRLEFQ